MLSAGGFFCFRTPILPFDVFQAWGQSLAPPSPSSQHEHDEIKLTQDRAPLRRFLQDVFRREDILEALFLASPDLVEAMARWMRDPDSQQALRAEHALVRYFSRMTSRATPFGLFSACSVARIGEAFRLDVSESARCARHTRLDMEYLVSLLESLASGETSWNSLTYRPNSSLYRTSRDLRYAESRVKGEFRSYHLVTVEITDYLDSTLRQSEAGATPEVLATHLAESNEGVSLQDAEEFVRQLVLCQILVPVSVPNVTGPEPRRSHYGARDPR